MDYVLSSFDTFTGIAENLIAFSFNVSLHFLGGMPADSDSDQIIRDEQRHVRVF